MTLVQRSNHEIVNAEVLTLIKLLPKDTVSNMNAITVMIREKQVKSETVKESSSSTTWTTDDLCSQHCQKKCKNVSLFLTLG
jgi:hypothetical protein